MANWLISWLNAGTISAINPPSAASPSSSPIVAPIGRGTQRRSSRSAKADSGRAMITTTKTPRTSVISCSNTRPATTSTPASRTAR